MTGGNMLVGHDDHEDGHDDDDQVRPSMRKLRQGMDSLLKTSRLMCSVLRLQQVKQSLITGDVGDSSG